LSRFPLGLRYMAASALCFSLMVAFVKAAGVRLPTMEIVLARSLVVLALSTLGLAARRRDFLGNEPKLLFLRGVLGFVALSCVYYAVIHLPLAEATVIQFTNPVLTALLAAPLLGESLRRTEVLLVLMSLLGVVVVARPPFLVGDAAAGLDPYAVGVALAGAVFTAAAYVMVRRLRREEPLLIVFYFAAVSVAASIPMVVPVFTMPRGWEWGLLLAIGVTTHMGQLFLTRGLQTERAGRATAVGYLQIVFATLLGAVFFGELPDGWTWVGAAAIVLSTVLLARVRPTAPLRAVRKG